MKNKVLGELSALKRMTGIELIEKWKKLIGGEPPSKNHLFLISRLAHRIQVLAYGDIKPETRRRLASLAEHEATGTPYTPQRDRLSVGTVLVREFKGVEHRVKVLSEGFEYNHVTYKSLSAVARHITGTQWNGLLFFGLRRK